MGMTTTSSMMQYNETIDTARNDDELDPVGSSEDADFEAAEMLSDDESVNTRILFIAEKQKILKRAATILLEEDSFDAAHVMTARDRKEKTSETPGSIWNEAKGILRALSSKTGEAEGIENTTPKITPSTRGPSSRAVRKRPKIDVGSVDRLSSNQYSTMIDSTVTPQAVSILSHQSGAGKWMARALVSSPKPYDLNVKGDDSSWKIISDPMQRHARGLRPPSPLNKNGYTDMQDAISVTQEARLLTMSTPPFKIIHANKSFLMKIGCKSQDVMGRAVESILQANGAPSSRDSDRGSIGIVLESGVLNLPTRNNTPSLRIRVVPVADCKGTLVTHAMIQLTGTETGTTAVQANPLPRIRRPTIRTYPQGMVGAVG